MTVLQNALLADAAMMRAFCGDRQQSGVSKEGSKNDFGKLQRVIAYYRGNEGTKG